MKQILSAAFKVCILIALLWLLLYFGFIDFSILGKILVRPEVLVLGVSAVFLSYLTGTLRWWLLLRSQKYRISYFHALQLYAISIFSSTFVPGGTASSDAIRILMLMRIVPGRGGQAALAVFGDRFIAVLMLSVLAAVLTLTLRPFRTGAADNPMFWLNICALLLPVSLIIAAWVVRWITRLPKFRRKQDSREQNRLAHVMAVMADFFDLALENKLNVVLAMLASLMTTALSLGAIVICSTVAAIPNLSSWEIAQAGALSMFANGLPLTPGGIGAGEIAFNEICFWIAGSKEHYPYATIFLAYSVICLIVSCYGAIALLNVRRLMTATAGQQPGGGIQGSFPTR